MNLIPLNFITQGEQTPLRRMMLERALASGGALPEYEITGNPVAFNTNVAKPLSAFTIPFLPVQSGTGDPSPSNVRPISGWSGVTAWRTGANMFDADSLVEVDINGSSRNAVAYKTPGKYKLKTFATGSSAYLSGIVKNADNTWSSVYYVVGGTYAQNQTITLTEGQTLYVYDMQGAPKETSVARFKGWEFMVVMGDDFPSAYADYTGQSYPVTFPALGANQWDEQWEIGGIGTNGEDVTSNGTIRSKDYIPCLPDTTYRVIAPSDTVFAVLAFYDEEKRFISELNGFNPGYGRKTPAGAYFMRFQMATNYGTTYNHDIAINYPNSVTAYEPYTNTVYGGTLDAVNGVLTVEYIKASARKSEFGEKTSQALEYRQTEYKYPETASGTSWGIARQQQKFNYGNIANPWSETSFGEYVGVMIWQEQFSKSYMRISEAVYQAMGDNDTAEITYKLATPYEIPLSDIPVPVTLIGDNTIWTDTNGGNTVKYLKKG